MGKGSSGGQMQQTINPTAAAQLPFLQTGWGTAQNLYNQDPTQLAPLNDVQIRGYGDLANQAAVFQGNYLPQTGSAYQNAVSGGMGLANSPAAPYFNQFAQGTSGPQQQIAGIGQTAQNMGGPGMDQLAASASGQYLNSNPYIAAAVKAAQDPVARQYQTATAPQTDYNFANVGRYGSGALLGARSQNEQNLGAALGNISTNMYNADYDRERRLQDAAAGQYGQLRNQGLQLGLDAARQALAGQQYGAGQLQQGYNTGNQAQLDALRQTPTLIQSMLAGPQAMMQTGAGLRALQQQQIDAPYTALSRYLTQIGQPTGPSGSSNQPLFQNDTANLLSALSGAGSLGKTLLGSGGLGGLGGSSVASAFPDLAATGGLGLGTWGTELLGSGAAASAAASAAPAAAKGAEAAIPLMFASDRRLKTDIRRLGELDNGLPVYEFRYKGDDQSRVGLMADEVEKVHPDAVIAGPGGFKWVDYAKAMR